MNTIATTILEQAKQLLQNKPSVIIAIDGRCGSGKTTLSMELANLCPCSVVHMDHFFLRPCQRTEQRFKEPGGNVDYERFMTDVMLPLSSGKSFSYRPFDCRKMELAEPVLIEPCLINIVEGSYSCHPALWAHYDLHVFLTTDKTTQLARIKKRNGIAAAKVFQEKWIPLEEAYFSAFHISQRCELNFKT